MLDSTDSLNTSGQRESREAVKLGVKGSVGGCLGTETEAEGGRGTCVSLRRYFSTSLGE